jgi:hypothetical protein
MSATVAKGAPFPATGIRHGWMRRSRLAVARLSVLVHRLALDRELAAGVEPDSSPQLTLRAAQLTGMRNRRRLADGLERLLADARRPGVLSSAIRPRASLMRSEAVLEALQRRLRSDERLAPRGLAILRRPLTDMGSSLYAAADSDELSSVLRLVAASLTDRSSGG